MVYNNFLSERGISMDNKQFGILAGTGIVCITLVFAVTKTVQMIVKEILKEKGI